jgi:predicted small secreted protein
MSCLTRVAHGRSKPKAIIYSRVIQRSHMACVTAVAVLCASLLAGCATAASSGQEITATATAPATVGVARASLSASIFDVGCDTIAAPADLSTVFSSGPTLSSEPRSSIESTSTFITAINQAGALTCNWGTLYESPAIGLFALAEGVDGYERARTELLETDNYRELDIFEGSFYECHYDYSDKPQLNCEWQILAGDVWVIVVLTNLLDSALDSQPTTADADTGFVEAPKDSAVVGFLSTVVSAIVQTPRLGLTKSPTTVGSCSDLIQIGKLASVLPGDVEVHDVLAAGNEISGYTTAAEGDPMGMIAMQRLGYRYCAVSPPPEGGYVSTIVTVAPGASWAFDSTEAQPLDGVGPAFSKCKSTSDGPFCLLATVTGDTLITVESNEPTPRVGTELLKGVLAHLG